MGENKATIGHSEERLPKVPKMGNKSKAKAGNKTISAYFCLFEGAPYGGLEGTSQWGARIFSLLPSSKLSAPPLNVSLNDPHVGKVSIKFVNIRLSV